MGTYQIENFKIIKNDDLPKGVVKAPVINKDNGMSNYYVLLEEDNLALSLTDLTKNLELSTSIEDYKNIENNGKNISICSNDEDLKEVGIPWEIKSHLGKETYTHEGDLNLLMNEKIFVNEIHKDNNNNFYLKIARIPCYELNEEAESLGFLISDVDYYLANNLNVIQNDYLKINNNLSIEYFKNIEAFNNAIESAKIQNSIKP